MKRSKSCNETMTVSRNNLFTFFKLMLFLKVVSKAASYNAVSIQILVPFSLA